jgi:putative tryptophan/tyrosine transport system substrate-binding protein
VGSLLRIRRWHRRSFMGFLASLGCAVPLQAVAQQVRPARLRRIGFLPGGDPSLIAAFKDELGRLGYVDGENIILETRIPRPNSSDLVTQVAELVHMDLELIAVVSLPAALLVREANPAMPMVVVTCPGMVSNGFAQSLETSRGQCHRHGRASARSYSEAPTPPEDCRAERNTSRAAFDDPWPRWS